ncbi:MAG: nickel-dependent hydrogenase large subunit [Candidatus Pacearchaeota archaeon]
MVREINLNHLCKVEGHASVYIRIKKNRVETVELKAEEGARFFEGLLLGKKAEDVLEIVSRICGICSSSHTIAAANALERALGKKVFKKTKVIREMMLIGERIRSHATHLYFLILPDYLNWGNKLRDNQRINEAIKLIRFGNKIIERIGGREIHPFIKKEEFLNLTDLEKEAKELRKIAERTVFLFNSLDYPEMERECEFLCLKKEGEYSFSEGELTSSDKRIKTSDYSRHLKENIKEYATSKFVLFDGRPYVCGASVRINNNFKEIDTRTKKIIRKNKIKIPIKNPFKNSIAQALEISICIEKFLQLTKMLKSLKEKEVVTNSFIGRGISAIEAPRGTLFHEYNVSKEGKIIYCNIITPTAQNLNQIEIDIKDYLNNLLKRKCSKERIIKDIERLIRAYDPCFSCSTHFLKVKLVEEK